MARPEVERRLIVNADDFGRSSAINRAVIQAHRQGILTTASLMVNESAAGEAIELARQNPGLGVGLHLTLLCGHAALSVAEAPGLVDPDGQFSSNPARAGFRYFFRRPLREPLRREIHEQFRKFQASGLLLDHVNGHLHIHLHPVVFRILMEESARLKIERVRLMYDPFWLNLRLAAGRLGYRALHALIFHCLAARARPGLEQRRIRHTRAVFGLLQNARVDESFILKLLPRIPPGDYELYSHPSLDEFVNEFNALISPRTRELIDTLGIKLIRYQDL